MISLYWFVTGLYNCNKRSLIGFVLGRSCNSIWLALSLCIPNYIFHFLYKTKWNVDVDEIWYVLCKDCRISYYTESIQRIDVVNNQTAWLTLSKISHTKKEPNTNKQTMGKRTYLDELNISKHSIFNSHVYKYTNRKVNITRTCKGHLKMGTANTHTRTQIEEVNWL